MGRLISNGLPVPEGFAVTADAYRYCVAQAGISEAMSSALKDVSDLDSARRASSAIRAMFATLVLTDDVATAIGDGYQTLGDRTSVAVRSSATAEDLAEASFAGQQDTYLWVQGYQDVARSLVSCWASLYTTRAILYRSRLDPEPRELAMAVVIQRMVEARTAGVLMTLEPVTGNAEVICIEAAFGLGESVVRGDVEVDLYRIRKSDLRIAYSDVSTKLHAYRFDPTCEAVVMANVDSSIAQSSCLSDDEIRHLAVLGLGAERAFGIPIDIEWAVDAAGETHLLQARPETVWSKHRTRAASDLAAPPTIDVALRNASDSVPFLTGVGVSAGTAEGIVRVLNDPDQDLQPGEILVVPVTDPSWASMMINSSALVVDTGGALSHAAIVAREFGIPCVVNTQTGTRTLRTGDRVKVDGQSGTVELLERTAVAAG